MHKKTILASLAVSGNNAGNIQARLSHIHHVFSSLSFLGKPNHLISLQGIVVIPQRGEEAGPVRHSLTCRCFSQCEAIFAFQIQMHWCTNSSGCLAKEGEYFYHSYEVMYENKEEEKHLRHPIENPN